MKLRQILYSSYLFSAIIVVIFAMFFAQTMVLEQKTADAVVIVALSMTLLFSIINYFIVKPILRIVAQLQEASKRNTSGEYVSIDDNTKIKEISCLVSHYNSMVNQMEKQFTQIKQIEKEKNEMISNLSHDIKTPISSLMVLGQAMSDGMLDDSEKDYYIKVILENCNRIADLSNELLQIAENNQYTHDDNTDEDEIWIDETLIKVLNMFKAKIEFSKREIFVEGSENQKPIYSKESYVFRILCNLIDNSLKYSKPGTPIKVRIADENDFLKISVQDYGQGIPEEEQEKIFQRTYRVEKSRNKETGGHGLGLAINQELLEKIGGTISVCSDIGKGSIFFVKIPYRIV